MIWQVESKFSIQRLLIELKPRQLKDEIISKLSLLSAIVVDFSIFNREHCYSIDIQNTVGDWN